MSDPVWAAWPRWAGLGALVGALDGVGIFWAPGEPYPAEIFLAAILKGLLVAALIALTLRAPVRLGRGLWIGALYGLGAALVVWLAKGGFRSMDAPYVVPAGIVMGAILGALVARFGFPRR